jgi:hypothetical protein
LQDLNPFIYWYCMNIIEKLRTRYDLWRLINAIDAKAFSTIHNRYRDYEPGLGSSKYLDIKKWMECSLRNSYLLHLHKKRSLTILDIGTGAGYFPYICSYFGHTALALDQTGNPLYDKLIQLLKVRRIEYRIEPFTQLPDMGVKADVITAFMICFNGHKTDKVWSVPEWDFFLQDLALHHAKPTANLFFSFNAENNGSCFTEELNDYLKSKGFLINGEKVFLDNLDEYRNNGGGLSA